MTTNYLTKSIRLEIKEMDDATGIFAGYASVFGVEDQGQDIVAKGAFANSLKQRGTTGVKMLYEHNTYEPIGHWTELAEDNHGLLARGKLLIEALPKAKEVHAMMRAQILDGMSIGYRTVKSSSDRGNSVRVLEELDLREISVVMFPMNEEAVISSVKADLPTAELIRVFEKWCTQDAASLGLKMTRSEVRQFLLPGFKSLLKTKQDAGDEVASTQPDVDWSILTDELRRSLEAARS